MIFRRTAPGSWRCSRSSGRPRWTRPLKGADDVSKHEVDKNGVEQAKVSDRRRHRLNPGRRFRVPTGRNAAIAGRHTSPSHTRHQREGRRRLWKRRSERAIRRVVTRRLEDAVRRERQRGSPSGLTLVDLACPGTLESSTVTPYDSSEASFATWRRTSASTATRSRTPADAIPARNEARGAAVRSPVPCAAAAASARTDSTSAGVRVGTPMSWARASIRFDLRPPSCRSPRIRAGVPAGAPWRIVSNSAGRWSPSATRSRGQSAIARSAGPAAF